MGMLGNQDPRHRYDVSSHDLEDFLAHANQLASKHGISIADVIEAKRVLEMERRNSLAVQTGDNHDEHMGGFGEILRGMASSLEDIAARKD